MTEPTIDTAMLETAAPAPPIDATPSAKPAGMVRRMGAMVYDALLMIAVLMIATVPFVPFLHGKVLMPQEVGWLAYAYRVWLVIVALLFFGFFWTRRGQTVGMQAWRLHLQSEQGERLSWPQSIKRCVLASLPWLPGLGMLTWAQDSHSSVLKTSGYVLLGLGVASLATLWLDTQRRTWYDRLTQSRVVVLLKR